VSGLVRSAEPVAVIIERMVGEAEVILERLGERDRLETR